MKSIERRLESLEQQSGQRRIDLNHVPDDALDEMEKILTAKSFFDLTEHDVRLFQRYGFIKEIETGPGVLGDWFDSKDVQRLGNGA